MSNQTGIGWTNSTWNPVTGCTRVSAGCDNCYAVAVTKKLAKFGQSNYLGLVNDGKSHFNGVVKCHEDMLLKPLLWKKPRRIFVNSMSDLFHKEVPFEFIDKVFAVMALCPQHTFQILTKRPERMAEYLNVWFRTNREPMRDFVESLSDARTLYTPDPIPNVWLGTSAEDQKSADERIPHLLRCPAAVRFLSCEPLLGPVNAGLDVCWGCGSCLITGNCICDDPARIHWVIVGGESGPGRREMRLEWLEGIVGQCRAASVPVFVKQASGPQPGMQGGIPDRIWAMKEFPEVTR